MQQTYNLLRLNYHVVSLTEVPKKKAIFAGKLIADSGSEPCFYSLGQQF